MLNFGNEPGLKSENSVCGPSVRSRRQVLTNSAPRAPHVSAERLEAVLVQQVGQPHSFGSGGPVTTYDEV